MHFLFRPSPFRLERTQPDLPGGGRRSVGRDSRRGAGTFQALAILGLVLPLLIAVATQYSTQIIPDFDDYDCDGPDDDDWDEKQPHFASTPLKSRSDRGVSLDDTAGTLAGLSHQASCRVRLERSRPPAASRPHWHPDLSRGPPLPEDPDCDPDPSSAGRGARTSDDPDHGLDRAGFLDGSRTSPPPSRRTEGLPGSSRPGASRERRARCGFALPSAQKTARLNADGPGRPDAEQKGVGI